MANICLQFGQYGHDLGDQLFDMLSLDSSRDDVNFWFDEDMQGKRFANSLIVDFNTERTATPNNAPVDRQWYIAEDYNTVLTKYGGYSNNWSVGNYVVGPALYDEVYNNLRKLCEKLDNVHGFLALGGIGGGTGSGIGTYICQLLKNHFPRKMLTNVAVLPCSAGEGSVQNYNSLFSIAKIYDESDALIMFSDGELKSLCHKINKLCGSQCDLMTGVVAEQLCCVLQCDVRNNMMKYLPLLTLHRDLKFLNMHSAPHYSFGSKKINSNYSWESIIKKLEGKLNFNQDKANPTEITKEINKCLSLLISVRDNSKTNVLPLLDAKFNHDSLYPSWTLSSHRLQLYQRSGQFRGKNKFCTVLVNNGLHVPLLEELIDKSWKTFNSRAFTHHFFMNGCSEVDFVETFLTLEQILQSYKSLS